MKKTLIVISLGAIAFTGSAQKKERPALLVDKITEAQYYTACEDPSSNFHKSNLNKVVFSDKMIDPLGNASQLKPEFIWGEKIYGLVFLQSSLLNYVGYSYGPNGSPGQDSVLFSGNDEKCTSYSVRYYIDDKPKIGGLILKKLSDKWTDKSFFPIIIFGEDADAGKPSDDFIQDIEILPDGKHKIRIEIVGVKMLHKTYGRIASGEFIINKKAGTKTGLGMTWGKVKTGMSDQALETKILAKANAQAKAAGWPETFTAVKIADEDWTIEKNQVTGAVLYRRIIAYVKATYPDGKCSFYQFYMHQDYNGAGYQNAFSKFQRTVKTDLVCD
jgi:hypothetical protein